MKKDHYSVLGVTPASEDVVIRAAYHALMRRYHPDADPSEEAAERSRVINEAYAALRDPAKRARYDQALGSRDLKFDPGHHSDQPRQLRSRLGPAAAIGVSLLAVGMIAFAIAPPTAEMSAPKPEPAGEPPVAGAATQTHVRAEVSPVKQAAQPCAESSAGRLIKEELFRRAGELRGADQARLRQASISAAVRIESGRPKVEGEGVAGCSGWVVIDLPPSLTVDRGRSNLNAELSYALAHDSGGMRIVSLSGEGRIVRMLATLAPAPSEPEQDRPAKPTEIASSEVRKPPVAEPKLKRAIPEPPPARTPAKSPTLPTSASVCSGSRAEQIVCANANLSSLDRQLALLYRQSWNQADEKRRATLLATRQHFNDRREACASPNCMTTAYLSRLKEISDIMAGRKPQ